MDDRVVEQRPVSNTGSSESKLADEEPVLEPNRASCWFASAQL